MWCCSPAPTAIETSNQRPINSRTDIAPQRREPILGRFFQLVETQIRPASSQHHQESQRFDPSVCSAVPKQRQTTSGCAVREWVTCFASSAGGKGVELKVSGLASNTSNTTAQLRSTRSRPGASLGPHGPTTAATRSTRQGLFVASIAQVWRIQGVNAGRCSMPMLEKR